MSKAKWKEGDEAFIIEKVKIVGEIGLNSGMAVKMSDGEEWRVPNEMLIKPEQLKYGVPKDTDVCFAIGAIGEIDGFKRKYDCFPEEAKGIRLIKDPLPEEEEVKPLIGLKPRNIHDEHRRSDIIGAIRRYSEANKPIPREWIDELESLN